MLKDRLGREIEKDTDVICDGCEQAILESEPRYRQSGEFIEGHIYCTDCNQQISRERLIAAAPDLLAACESFLHVGVDEYGQIESIDKLIKAVNCASAAIHKATKGVE